MTDRRSQGGQPTRQRASLALCLLLLLVPAAGLAPATANTGQPARYNIGLEQVSAGLAPGTTFHGGEVVSVSPQLGRITVQAPSSGLADRLDGMAGIRYVEPDPMIDWTLTVPDDELYSVQYGPQQVRAPWAWNLTYGDPSVDVCIVDTGVYLGHEDLETSDYQGGIDIINGDDDPADDNGHGTWVTGIALATTNNSHGIAGISQAGFHAAKVLDHEGQGRTSWVADGIAWCADQGARIINLSLGAPTGSTTLADAVAYAASKGALLVAAAGNDRCDGCIGYPAAYPEVIAVTGTQEHMDPWPGSSTGPEAELAAPAHDIGSLSADHDDGYASASGTSAAAPHVAGVAALILSVRPELSAESLRALMNETARDLGSAGHDNVTGHGLVDASAATDRFLPTAPTELSAQAGLVPGTLVITWQPPADDGGRPLTTYELQRTDPAGTGTKTIELSAGTTSYTDDDPSKVGPLPYRYTIRAVTETGAGPWSQTICATPMHGQVIEDHSCQAAGPEGPTDPG